MKEGDNLMEHMTYMTSLAEQLRELKEDISTKKFATVILGSLLDSYENFISSLNARNIDELEWDSIKGSLIEEYMNRKEKDEKQIPTSNDALFTSGNRRQFNHRAHSARGTGRPTSSRLNFRREGSGGSRDHHSRTSQSRNQNGSEESRGPKCFKCQEYGHIVKNCPLSNKKGAGHSIVAQENKGEPNARQKSIKQDQNQLELDFQEISLVSSTNCKLTNGWYIDSAPSKDMTFNKGLIFDFIEYNRPLNISLGDDTVILALGESKVKLTCCNGFDKVVLVLYKVLYVPKLAKNVLSIPAMA